MITCPQCQSSDFTKHNKKFTFICDDCNFEFTLPLLTAQTLTPLRIFLSYGHDQNEELVIKIKADLEKRGHEVWFDKREIKSGQNWRRSIIDGILKSNLILSFLSKHAMRDPGVCLDEIGIAIGFKGGNIKTILVESEEEVTPPPSISYIQWLDMQKWKEVKEGAIEVWESWYHEKLTELIAVIESDESLRFAGEIETLSGFLKPISSESRISHLLRKGFIGREWLTEAVENWRTCNDRSSRIFWIMGNPGVGKSAFSAHLCHFGKDRVIAAHFCEWNKPDHRDACRVIRSLAFQLATRLPEYRKLLLSLPEINTLDKKNASELFDYLFTNPLKHVIVCGRDRSLILIDALDEAKEGESNPLVEMLAQNAVNLPEWLGIVITSRDDKNVSDPLQELNPYLLNTDSKANKEDICNYIELELNELLNNKTDARNIVNQIIEKSEGVFLYVEWVCKDIKKGNLSLEKLDKFPKGLGGIFWQFFQRQFPNAEIYGNNIRPILRVILASQEAFPLYMLGMLFSWQKEELNDFTRMLGSLFPIIKDNGQMLVKPYHKSLIDWLTDEEKAGSYFVSINVGQMMLADFGWKQFVQGPENMDSYFIKWLPRHLLLLERWDDLINLLCDLDFIQAKAEAKLTYHLVQDFNRVLEFIPENKKSFKEEMEQEKIMDKYTKDLILYAKGKISNFEIPESMTPWSTEKTNAEVNRIINNTSRLDKLKAFFQFLRHETTNLQYNANEFNLFTYQQAWNYAGDGPVGNSANKLQNLTCKSILLRISSTRPAWNPLPQIKQTLIGHKNPVYTVSITPDGKWAISGSSDSTCIFWDLTTGEPLHTLIGHSLCVTAVAITPDGRTAFSGSDDKTCILWDLITGTAIKNLSSNNSCIKTVSITPDGRLALSYYDDNKVILWDLSTGKVLQTLIGHNSEVLVVSITPNSKSAFFCYEDNTCIYWDLKTGEILYTPKEITSRFRNDSFTPDGKWAISISSENENCQLLDLTSGEVINTLIGHASSITSVAITPDGRTGLSGSTDFTCILWDLTIGRTNKVKELKHTSAITAISVTPDGKNAFSGSWDNSCILWELSTGIALKVFTGHTENVHDVAITPDGKMAISCSGDNTCILWDLISGMTIYTLKGHSSAVRTVSISPDGKSAFSSSQDKTIIIWDLITGEMVQKIRGFHMWNTNILFTPDSKRLIINSLTKIINIWNLTTGEVLKTIEGWPTVPNSFLITPDGKKVLSSALGYMYFLWNLATDEIKFGKEDHSYWITSLSISPDGTRIFTSSDDHSLILWDLKSGSKLAKIIINTSISSAKLFPGGIVLGLYSGEIILLNIDKEIICPDEAITTIQQLWDFEFQKYLELSVNCPLCCNRFPPPASVLTTINKITKKSNLKLEQSACLELPPEVWNEPGLMANCPNCSKKLKFNPYISFGLNIKKFKRPKNRTNSILQ